MSSSEVQKEVGPSPALATYAGAWIIALGVVVTVAAVGEPHLIPWLAAIGIVGAGVARSIYWSVNASRLSIVIEGAAGRVVVRRRGQILIAATKYEILGARIEPSSLFHLMSPTGTTAYLEVTFHRDDVREVELWMPLRFQERRLEKELMRVWSPMMREW